MRTAGACFACGRSSRRSKRAPEGRDLGPRARPPARRSRMSREGERAAFALSEARARATDTATTGSARATSRRRRHRGCRRHLGPRGRRNRGMSRQAALARSARAAQRRSPDRLFRTDAAPHRFGPQDPLCSTRRAPPALRRRVWGAGSCAGAGRLRPRSSGGSVGPSREARFRSRGPGTCEGRALASLFLLRAAVVDAAV